MFMYMQPITNIPSPHMSYEGVVERLLFFFGNGEASCWLLRFAILSICCFVYLEMVFSCTGFLTRLVTPGTADRWFKISSTRRGRSLATCLRTRRESCDHISILVNLVSYQFQLPAASPVVSIVKRSSPSDTLPLLNVVVQSRRSDLNVGE